MTAQTPKSTVAAFAADPSSSGQARSFVRDSLSRMGLSGKVVDTAVLVASELVTNAVLHAHAGPVITVHMEEDFVRLEVEDNSEMFPLLRNYGQDAVTGRGLDVVEASANNWGVETTQNGKTVWAEFAFDPASPVGGVSEVAKIEHERAMADAHESINGAEFVVYFRAIPVELFLELEQHHEALLREFELLTIGFEQSPAEGVSDTLVALVNEVKPVLSARLSAFRPQVAEAHNAGKKVCDLSGPCDATTIRWTKRFEALMLEADRLSREGRLLTQTASAPVTQLRQWMIDEMARQYVDRLPAQVTPKFKS